ncbi:formate/nitrite transporter family protein [bacterium]|nr:formate/nitrite transporter family protein [bacterium]
MDNIQNNFFPKEIALKAENTGVIKGNLAFFPTLFLAILAGAFIGLGAALYTLAITGNGFDDAIRLPFGIIKLIGGIGFCLGLILVVIAGAELFTGNVLLIMAVASKKLPMVKLLRNWSIVYIGNFIGSILTAYFIFTTGQYKFMEGLVGLSAMTIATAKCDLPFLEALMRGIYCNTLVCLAIWLTMAGRSVTDKILGILFPITAFVAMGFEHVVANMYFIPIGLFIKNGAPVEFGNIIGKTVSTFDSLSWTNFLYVNLVPVTLGNIIGGFLVGLMYWVIYCHPNLLNAGNQSILLKELIGIGRRRYKRHDVNGDVILRCGTYTLKGRSVDISYGGLVSIFKEEECLLKKGEEILVDFVSEDKKLNINGAMGTVLRKRIHKKTFDCEHNIEIAIKFTTIDKKDIIDNYIKHIKNSKAKVNET